MIIRKNITIYDNYKKIKLKTYMNLTEKNLEDNLINY